ncbi:two component transcriptional regulator, LuxR family [Gloeothece citriformis PCC 7424]|uniref:Two component transcriptional regulator, LuxR family n=1 Tax=Gloeothece citriformis (strain PCC 7424) TaxID=65393 RepID=B7K817_GLOC7|nr:response regulator transcription factor [Gloeothece citriformis]ACK68505.1 two component transcriptional regulator, LuxR family [Gloeothece citriformis PCC 7424]
MPLLILIADDDPGIRLAVKDFLELSGYSVVTAKNGQEALSLLETYHPHLLVSDIKMPRTNGYELVAQVRQRPEFRLLPVVFLTEKSTTSERIRGYQAGCDVYLPKPFEMEELGAVIRNLLERSQIIESEWRYKNRQIAQKQAHSPKIEPEEKIIDPLPPKPTVELPELTEREKQVLELLAQGLSNVEIGQKLHLSPRTVEKYVSSLLRKTETNNRAELVRFALDNDLVD